MTQPEPSSSTQQQGDEPFMSVAELKAYIAEVESAKASQSYGAIERAEKAKKEMIAKLMQYVDIYARERPIFLEPPEGGCGARGDGDAGHSFSVRALLRHGRAINNAEAGWPETLVGQPRQFYEIWKERLEPQGYRLKVMIIEWPNGFPGDVGMYVAWH